MYYDIYSMFKKCHVEEKLTSGNPQACVSKWHLIVVLSLSTEVANNELIYALSVVYYNALLIVFVV